MSLFTERDYKRVLQAKISENDSERGYKALLAEAAGMQPSFLSQILHSHVHPTPDHAAGMAAFWKLTADEQEYFMELVNLARASSDRLKAIIEARLERLRKKSENLAIRFKKKSAMEEEQQALYYSSWHFSAIHILLTIPEFQSANAIARRLEVPEAFVQSCLEKMQAMGLVEARPQQKWGVSKLDIHLPKGSPLTSINHANWRQRAVTDSQVRRQGSVHYTAVHSLSLKDFEEIKARLLQMIDQSRAIVAPSKEEDLACITLDWFWV